VTALTMPKLTMKRGDRSGGGKLKRPRFRSGATSVRFEPDHPADEGIDQYQERELLPVLAQPERDAGPR